MIFEDLSQITQIPIENRLEHLGNGSKTRTIMRKYRSNMMINPLNLKHLNCIDESSSDMITLNLEDAIAPSRKKEALYNIALFLSHLHTSNSLIIVRTNAIGDGGEDEIRFLNDFSFDAIRIPKVTNRDDISKALNLLSNEKELHISLETAEAFRNLTNLRIDERLTTANLGILDLLTSLKLPQNIVKKGNPTIDYILSKFLIDAKSCGIHPISFMFQEYKDTQTFKEWCIYEKMMGYESKACMGPAQVSITNEVFGLDKHIIERAKYIKKIFEKSASTGINGFMDEKYGFIDEPIYRDAIITLQREENDA